MVLKSGKVKVSEAIGAMEWLPCNDMGESAQEAQRLARKAAPDNVAFLSYVVRTDGFSSPAQRVRAATTLLDVAGLLSHDSKATGLFGGEGDEAERCAGDGGVS
jgi:hypothetical protein